MTPQPRGEGKAHSRRLGVALGKLNEMRDEVDRVEGLATGYRCAHASARHRSTGSGLLNGLTAQFLSNVAQADPRQSTSLDSLLNRRYCPTMSYGNRSPLLKDAEALLDYRTNQQIAVGDHGAVVLRTHTTQTDTAIRPLALQRSRFHRHDCCRPSGGRGGEAPLPSENPLETP